MLKEFSKGFQSFLKAPRFILKHKLGWALLVPIFLNIIFLSLGFGIFSSLSNLSSDYLTTYLETALDGFEGSGVVLSFIRGLLWVLFELAFLLLYAYVGGFIVLMILSPLLAYLSEKTEELIDGTTYPFSWPQFLKDIWRGILVALRSLFYELLLTLTIFIVTLIPVVNLVGPALFFLVTSYFYGYSFLDYNLERRRLTSKHSESYVFKHKGMAIGVGAPYALLLIIPVIGPSLAGFAAIFGTVAATITWKEVEKNG